MATGKYKIRWIDTDGKRRQKTYSVGEDAPHLSIANVRRVISITVPVGNSLRAIMKVVKLKGML